jgi:uncharacterized membrane protein YsdA (DUF1294 family)
MATSGTIVTAALIALNLVTFAVFAWDKFCATRGRRRVSEQALLGLMAVGGSPGGWAAMLLFHHKTQKAIFKLVAIGIVVVQVVALVAIYALLAGQ